MVQEQSTPKAIRSTQVPSYLFAHISLGKEKVNELF